MSRKSERFQTLVVVKDKVPTWDDYKNWEVSVGSHNLVWLIDKRDFSKIAHINQDEWVNMIDTGSYFIKEVVRCFRKELDQLKKDRKELELLERDDNLMYEWIP